MAFHLSATALNRAISHLSKYGDTDVFPHLPEIAFLRENKAAVVDELAQLDLDTFNPSGAVEALAPKSRYGFRITHQLPPLDTVLLLASVIEVGSLIEKHRSSPELQSAFSYRFDDSGSEKLFSANRTYRDWLNYQSGYLSNNLKIKQVVSTDISDFYARINFHRLENLLDEAAPNHGSCRFIKKHIRIIRAKQSFGLPVGGSAARLLAELALRDTDQALHDNGFVSTRFVDDFRLFLHSGQDPYEALGFLAQQLGINEGLSLNVAKTAVEKKVDYAHRLKQMTSDIADEAEGVALETLTASIYFDTDFDLEDLEALKGLNLLGFLSEEISKDDYDIGRIKVIFRALRIAKPSGTAEFIIGNFSELVVFSRELVLLMEEIEGDELGCFEGIRSDVIDAILNPPASSVQVIRTWLLEIFVRNIISIDHPSLKLISNVGGILDRRQILLIRGRLSDKNFFRLHKTGGTGLTDFERTCFVWGAACLPDDEFEKWLPNVKAAFNGPTGQLFLKWCQKQKPKLITKLSHSVEEQPD
jgi:hypothetical protein